MVITKALSCAHIQDIMTKNINVLTNLFLSFWLHVKCLGWREEQNEILIILSNLIMQTDGKFA